MNRPHSLLAIICARCGNSELVGGDPQDALEDLIANYGYFVPTDPDWTEYYGDLVCCKSCHADYVELYDSGEGVDE